MIFGANYVFVCMPSGSEIQEWLVAISGRSGNLSVCFEGSFVCFGMPWGPEIPRWLFAI